MKSIKFSILVFFTALLGGLTAFAQENCSSYYPMKKGLKFEITHYDDNGKKITGMTKNEVIDFSSSGDKDIATMRTIVEDKKGEQTLDANYNIICSGDKVTIDLNEMMKQQMAEQMKENEAEIEISGINAIFPNDMKIGDKLPDSNMEMKIKAGSINMNFTVNTTNREVVKMETLTTPAGTFDCVVISSETHTKMLVSKTIVSKIWLAKGYGMIKQEDYSKGGKLTGYQLLTSYTQ